MSYNWPSWTGSLPVRFSALGLCFHFLKAHETIPLLPFHVSPSSPVHPLQLLNPTAWNLSTFLFTRNTSTKIITTVGDDGWWFRYGSLVWMKRYSSEPVYMLLVLQILWSGSGGKQWRKTLRGVEVTVFRVVLSWLTLTGPWEKRGIWIKFWERHIRIS